MKSGKRMPSVNLNGPLNRTERESRNKSERPASSASGYAHAGPRPAGDRKRTPGKWNRRNEALTYPDAFAPPPNSRKGRKKRKQEKRKVFFRGPVLKLLIFFVIFAGVAAFIAFYPAFYVQSVHIDGTKHIVSADIMSCFEKPMGEHFLVGLGGSIRQWIGFRYGNIEKRIAEGVPLVGTVRVSFRFPSQIAISVEEKAEVIALRRPGGFALLDRSFTVIRLTEQQDFDLPVLEGARFISEPAEGRPIELEDQDALHSVVSITAAMIRNDNAEGRGGKALMSAVRKIKKLDASVFCLFIPIEQGGEIRVKLEDNRSLPQKLARLSDLLNHMNLSERGAGELDMTGERAYFRPDA